MYPSHPLTVDAPNFLRILTRLSRYPTQLSNPEGLKLGGPHSSIPLCGSRESPRSPSDHMRLTRRAGGEIGGGTREAGRETQRGRPASTRNGDYETKGEGALTECFLTFS